MLYNLLQKKEEAEPTSKLLNAALNITTVRSITGELETLEPLNFKFVCEVRNGYHCIRKGNYRSSSILPMSFDQNLAIIVFFASSLYLMKRSVKVLRLGLTVLKFPIGEKNIPQISETFWPS